MMDDLRILVTGGTIDKEHDPVTEGLVFAGRSFIPDMLSVCRVPDTKYDVLMLKDSFDITDQDRDAMIDAINSCPEKNIIITHGTSTMPETALYLQKNIHNKTVVLTGAMRPFSLFMSDAGFNLGSAISAVQLLTNGVYVTMNGQIFEAGTVRKNAELCQFESI